jgi:glucose/arabinose dehydrogenase
MPTLRLAVVTAALALAACAGGKAAPPPAAQAPDPAAPAPAARAPAPSAPLPATGLELAVEPATAEVLVDGEPRGLVDELASGVLGLPPGIYQVSLRAPGHVTWRAEVAVRAGRERIEVRLARKEPTAR